MNIEHCAVWKGRARQRLLNRQDNESTRFRKGTEQTMRIRKQLVTFFGAAALSLGIHAADIPVTPGDNALAQAIAAANPGDTLLLENANYRSEGDLPINKTLKLMGSGGNARILLNCGDLVISGPDINVGIEGVSLVDAWGLDLILHYYRHILDRDPDANGQSFWETENNRLRGLAVEPKEAFIVMAVYFFNSAEYLARNTDHATFIGHLYRTFFNREADQGGLNYWLGQIADGMPRDIVMFNFLFSTEFDNFMAGCEGDDPSRAEVLAVVDFYRGILNRTPDSGGLTTWAEQFQTAQCNSAEHVYTKVEDISWSFLNSQEYLTRERSNAEYVTDLYNAFMRRGGDLAGVSYWIDELNSGAQTRYQLWQAFIASAEFSTRLQAMVDQGCKQ
jgi:hypothetical protein